MRIDGKNLNVTDEVIVEDGVEITVNTAVVAVTSDALRLGCEITIREQDAWVRKMPAATDGSTRKGEFIEKGGVFSAQSNKSDTIYSGEISIINARDGRNPVFYVTRY